jgi:ferredoxin-like protein FixX
MKTIEIGVNVDEKLSLDKFNVDEGQAHIAVVPNAAREEFEKLVLACPAALYKFDPETDAQLFDYAGCLECGTCRILCGKTILEKWEYPNSTMGIEFRWG